MTCFGRHLSRDLRQDPVHGVIRVAARQGRRGCARRQKAEPRQRIGQIAVRGHLGRVRPCADELVDGSDWIEALDVTVEQARLVLLVADDPVAPAPPDLERHAGERDLPCPVERAADRVSAGICGRRPADLATREPLQAIDRREGDRTPDIAPPCSSARRTRLRRRAVAETARGEEGFPVRPCCRRTRRRDGCRCAATVRRAPRSAASVPGRGSLRGLPTRRASASGLGPRG